jgi:hypothetical protein
MNREKYLDKISDEFMSILYKYIPNKMITGNGYSEMSFDARLSKFNNSYSDSQYFYKGNKKFIHWTTIQNLMSVINYREIRLYNLHNSSDADEFNYAAEHLKLPKESIDYAKEFLYTFSFCKSSELDNPDLWQEYGKNYEGVAIEFEIVNNPKEWKSFMLSPIFYEIPENFKKMVDELEEFKLKHPNASTNIDLGKLIAFHKKPDFSKELEIRLATYYPFEKAEEYDTFCNTEFRFDEKRPRVTDYFGLKLWVDNSSPWVKNEDIDLDRSQRVNDKYFIEKPKIKITNIYFGKNCGINNKDFIPFRKKLEYITKIKLGYDIEDLKLNLYG